MKSLGLQKLTVLSAGLILLMSACGKKSTSTSDAAVEDTSTSASVAESVGGALSGSGSGGTQASYQFQLPSTFMSRVRSEISPFPNAAAQLLCPTFRSTDSACNTSAGSMWLSYQDCSFSGRATWSGVQLLKMSSGSASCGSFPNPGASNILYRQFVSAASSTTPSEVTVSAGGYEAVISDASSNLSNFDGVTIPTFTNGGYGVKVSFAADGSRSAIEIGHHVVVSGVFDHSVSGSLSISEGVGASSRSLSGSVQVYHNLLRVVGNSSFNNVTHSDMCCVPTSGSITTSFSAGSNVTPTVLGLRLVGKSETLTFTGCGTAILEDTSGVAKNVTLKRCF